LKKWLSEKSAALLQSKYCEWSIFQVEEFDTFGFDVISLCENEDLYQLRENAKEEHLTDQIVRSE
jgi:hypothetical protein